MTALEKITHLYNSAQEMQRISNNAHTIWGISLLLIAFLAFFYSLGYKKKFLLQVISIVLLITVVVFFMYLLLNRGVGNFWNLSQIIVAYPEFYVHIAMSLISSFGVIVELLVISGKIKHKLAPLALPLFSLVGVGFLFIVHPRSTLHDENTMFIHSLIGLALIFYRNNGSSAAID